MHDQIKNISLSQKLTACQIAKQLHVSMKLVTKTLKDENSSLRYQFLVEYLGHEHNNAEPLDGWFREIQIEGDMTLNGLNDCIQHVLGWDNTHCYIFTVHEKHYAYLGEDDDFVVEDIFENHCSTKIPLYLLSLSENDSLIYNSDFVDDHFFRLTLSGIESATESVLSRVTGAGGKNLSQYRHPYYDEEVSCAKAKSECVDVDKINSALSKASSIRRHDITAVDFIVRKDKDTLERWSLDSLANVYSKQYSVKISSHAISKSLKDAQYAIKKARRGRQTSEVPPDVLHLRFTASQ